MQDTPSILLKYILMKDYSLFIFQTMLIQLNKENFIVAVSPSIDSWAVKIFSNLDLCKSS